jgi:hypothetical protein
MISTTDLIVIAVGYLLGLGVGFWYGMRSGKDKFWRMPSSSWKVRK